MRRVQNPNSVVRCLYVPTAVAKPQATVDSRGCEETEPASGWPKDRFLTPGPDEDFVDPADEYKMPWEEDMPVKDMPLSEGVKSKASNALSYAASIGLEISGSRELVTDACKLVLEFRDIFSTKRDPLFVAFKEAAALRLFSAKLFERASSASQP
jgi:hypothetical protein